MEIVPGIHKVDGVLGPSVYLLEDDEGLALIDTSLAWNVERILSYIGRIGRTPRELKYIFITHSHPDHTGTAALLKARTGATILGHEADARRDSRGQASLSYLRFFGGLSWPLPFLRRVPMDRALEDGQLLPVRGGLRVLHSPGHTPGSICLYLEREGVLFAGDLVISTRGRVCRSLAFPGANPREYEASLKRIAQMEFSVVCSGHGEPLVGNADEKMRKLQATPPRFPLLRSLASL